jgi:hypothetical protein
MLWRAHVRFDFIGGKDNNEYQKLMAAFLQAGWNYVETSAVAIETDDLNNIMLGMEICARQFPQAGAVSAFLFDVQGSEDFGGKVYVGAKNHPNALDDICKRPLPSERGAEEPKSPDAAAN